MSDHTRDVVHTRAAEMHASLMRRIKAEAWDEGRKSGLDTGMAIAEVATGTKPPPYPELEPNPYRQEQDR